MIADSAEAPLRRRDHGRAVRRARLRRASPNRTARYVMTARAAMKTLGIKDPGKHMIVSAFITHKTGDLSTIILKRTPFTPAEVARYTTAAARRCPKVTDGRGRRASSRGPSVVLAARGARPTRRPQQIAAAYPRDISAVSDDSPFFWHFVAVRQRDPQHLPPARRARTPRTRSASGCCCCCSASSVLYAAVFLLAPFFFVRKEWRALPAQGDLGGLLRRARARLHVLRDHDDPAARAVPRLPDLFADGHARVDPRVHRDRRAR